MNHPISITQRHLDILDQGYNPLMVEMKQDLKETQERYSQTLLAVRQIHGRTKPRGRKTACLLLLLGALTGIGYMGALWEVTSMIASAQEVPSVTATVQPKT